MSPDYVCEHRHDGLPFVPSTIPGCTVCPVCNPELAAKRLAQDTLFGGVA